MHASGSIRPELAHDEALWKSAESLRMQLDAAEYKHVVLGLIFLKYISDCCDVDACMRGAKKTTQKNDARSTAALSAKNTRARRFRVPSEASWEHLRRLAGHPDIARKVDQAVLAIEAANPRLENKLPREYARRGVPPETMRGLIELISSTTFMGDFRRTRDPLGRVYEYLLGKFARAEGKRGGEFFTPRCIVRLLVEMLEPCCGIVYDPCCGTAGMFVHSEHFVEKHGREADSISIFGQESNCTTWRLAQMNLAIRDMDADLGPCPADSLLHDLHPDLKADAILANPPFNAANWSGHLPDDDARWQFGKPPLDNANFAWIQHFIHHLAQPNGKGGGVAGFVMANSSLACGPRGGGDIRRRIVEADLVEAIIALPSHLFVNTHIPACLWFISRDKSGKNLPWGGRRHFGETLFIDARELGTLRTRTQRVFTGSEDGETQDSDGRGDPKHTTDIGRIIYTFRQWRGEPPPEWWHDAEHGAWNYGDIPGFCRAETIEGITRHDFVLSPGRYVGTAEQTAAGAAHAEEYLRAVDELERSLDEGERLTELVREQLQGVEFEGQSDPASK